MSALISGVKNFVSIANSFVRALPFSQVKSAKAKGSAFAPLAAPDLPFSVACALTEATTLSAGMTFELASAAAGDDVALAVLPTAAAAVGLTGPGCDEGGAAAVAVGELFLVSSSATRFSSCSMRSSIQRSRSVNGAGASILGASLLAGAVFAGGLVVSLSSASKRIGTTPTHSNVARSICISLPSCLNMRMSLLRILMLGNGLLMEQIASLAGANAATSL